MPDDAASASETQFPVPFGKYLLTELIAVGGMAEVYKGKIFGASGFEKEMVVKRILPRYAKNPNFVQMLIDEAKIAVNLTHGNIVPIYELGEYEGSYYIAMEYVEGQTILDVLRTAHGQRSKLPWPFALFTCAEVAAGLAYAHSRKRPDGTPLGLVHRDINPRNIVVTKDGEVKILDFGIARASTKKHQTASGVIKGTPGYMSPEQMKGRSVDYRSDLYCLGILCHELLTLRRLFPAWTVKEMRQLFEEKTIQPPSRLNPDVPPYVDDVVMKCLDPDPTQRFEDAGEFEEALRHCIAQSGTATTSRGLAREIKALENLPPSGLHQTPPKAPPSLEPSGPEPPTTSEKFPASRASQSGEPSGVGHMVGDGMSGPAPVPPGTQPMAQAEGATPSSEGPGFIIALDSGDKRETVDDVEKRPLHQLEPLPKSQHAPKLDAPRTQVLAQNDDLTWANQIGNDAELLALAKATGVAPGQTRNKLLIAAGIAAVILIPVIFWYAPDLIATVQRAMEGKVLRPGAIVVKTIPSGAEVILDGKTIGKTNLRMTGVDPDANHQLVVKPEGMDPIQIEFTPSDFKPMEGLPTYLFERNFSEPEEPEVKEPEPEEKPRPKKRRGKKRRRKRRK